jgi:hypothetical protein
MSSNVAQDFEGNAEAERLQEEFAAKGNKKPVAAAKPATKAVAKTAKKPAAKKKTTPTKKCWTKCPAQKKLLTPARLSCCENNIRRV